MKSFAAYLSAAITLIPLMIPLCTTDAYANERTTPERRPGDSIRTCSGPVVYDWSVDRREGAPAPSGPLSLKWQDYEQRGYMSTQKRAFEAAELAMTNALQKANEDGAPDTVALSLLERLMVCTANQGKYDTALQYTELAIRFAQRMKVDDVHLSNLFAAKGNVQRQLKKYTQAELSYSEAHKLCPQASIPIWGLARVKMDEGNLKESRKLYEDAFASGEPGPPEYTRYAECCFRLGDYEAAQKALEKGLAKDESELGMQHPALAAELNDLAVVFAAQGKTEEARVQMKRAVDLCTKYKYADLQDWTANLQLVQK